MEDPSFLDQIQFWHWLILAAVLAAIEIVAPGVFFIWLGAAAALTGIIALIVPGWEMQALIFAVLAVIAVWGGNKFQRATAGDQPTTTLNRRGAQLIGRIVSLSQPIVNGRGTAKVDDSTWRVEGPDLPAGTQVTVTGVDGSVLKVEPK